MRFQNERNRLLLTVPMTQSSTSSLRARLESVRVRELGGIVALLGDTELTDAGQRTLKALGSAGQGETGLEDLRSLHVGSVIDRDYHLGLTTSLIGPELLKPGVPTPVLDVVSQILSATPHHCLVDFGHCSTELEFQNEDLLHRAALAVRHRMIPLLRLRDIHYSADIDTACRVRQALGPDACMALRFSASLKCLSEARNLAQIMVIDDCINARNFINLALADTLAEAMDTPSDQEQFSRHSMSTH